MELELEENMPCLSGVVWSIDRLVLGNQMMWLGRLLVRLSGSCFRCEDVFFEEAMLNELLQIFFGGSNSGRFGSL